MGLLLPTQRHTATHEQNQIFIEVVNRHKPATPRLPSGARPAMSLFDLEAVSSSRPAVTRGRAWARREGIFALHVPGGPLA
jgi:hypothetical protein